MSISHHLLRTTWQQTSCLSRVLRSQKCINFSRNLSEYVKRKLTLDYCVFAAVTTHLHLAPIIVCHGLFGNKKEWENVCRELNVKTGRKVISYDAVNHGASPHHGSMNYRDMALDLVTLVEKLNIKEKVVCIGHRMGGKTAMTVALAQPERIDRLAIIDIVPCTREKSILGDTAPLLKELLNMSLNSFKTKEEVEEQLSSMNMEPLLHEAIIGNINESPNGLLWTINLQGLIDNYQDLLSFPSFNEEVSFPGPTMFLSGDGSALLSRQDYPSIIKRFPSAELHNLEEYHFNMHKNHPESMLNILSAFLQQ